MKNVRLFTFVLILGTLVLSACGAAPATATPAPVATSGSTKVEAMPVTFVGIVDRIDGDQWVISGTTVTVHEAVVRNGPFAAGDQVRVEGLVHPDGSFTILRVESPTPQETATLPPVSADNSNEAPINANTNDANVNDDNSNAVNANGNDDNSNDDGGNSNDDNSNDDNGGNSNDDSGNDDNSGSGGGNDNSGDDDDNSNDD
jgi:hypothetical protein